MGLSSLYIIGEQTFGVNIWIKGTLIGKKIDKNT